MDLRDNKALTPVESGFPIRSLTMDVTKRCNLACDYCFAHCFSEYEKVDMTMETATKVVDWILDEGTRGKENKIDISFWGGEPLLRWDFVKEVILYAEGKAKEKGVTVSFGGTTNVTLLTPEKFDFMDEHRVRFLLSIDGTKEHHDKHRVFKGGLGSHDTIMKNVGPILKRWPNSQVRFSYSVENLDGFLEDLTFLHSLGFHDIVYSPVCEGDWNDERIAKLHEMWELAAQWYIDEKKKDPQLHCKFIEDACRHTHGAPMGNASPCGAGRGYIGVSVDGAIYPCHRFNKFDDKRPWYEREVCLGHIDYGILNQQWRENFTKWNADKDLPDSCKACKAFKVNCTGGCWASNFDVMGDLRVNPRVACETAKASMNQAMLVEKGLGKGYIASLMGQRNSKGNLPPAQGCQCYNVQDNIYGRQVINKRDPYSCLCNMSTYGVKPAKIESCGCYNVENNGITYKDSSKASCRNFTLQKECCTPPNKKVEELKELDEQIKAKLKELEVLEKVLKNQLPD